VEGETLLIHHFEPASRANGPGLRFVVWVQGCTLGCPGCFNPETHLKIGGERLAVERLAGLILNNKDEIEGVSISGGEPFQQIAGVRQLLGLIKARSKLSTLVFTGFEWQEIQRLPGAAETLPLIDVLLAGRYLQDQRVAQGLLGSANKTVHYLSKRYSASDLAGIPEAEVVIKTDGSVISTGIDPLTR